MKVLIIEDDSSIRETLRELLELNGLEVLAAANGAEGLQLAEAKPDFVFCDLTMPGMDGFAVLEALRARETGQLVPFIFLTAKADRSEQRRGMVLGADDYITKPFSEKDIMDAITARSRRQKTLQDRMLEAEVQQQRQAGAEWSHELLTPLNGIRGGLQLLEMEIDTISGEDLRELVALIRAGVDRQERISRKLIRYFELVRIKSTTQPPVGFRCRAENAVPAGLRRAVAGHERKTDIELRCAAGNVALPEAFLADAIAELADNALRFSSPGERVTVTGEVTGPSFLIEVTDTGSGMSAEERSNIAPFNQFGRAKREQQGLGLGLAIARLVAQAGGGTLELHAGPGGRGVRAILRLPLA